MSEARFRDRAAGRNSARLVFHGSDIYIETTGNHDGVVVTTAVRMTRVEFWATLRSLGVMP